MLIDIYERDRLELGHTNNSSENCDCQNTMSHLHKNHSLTSKCFMQICRLNFEYDQGRIPRVNSLRKTCSHCYLQSLSFLYVFLPMKTFSPQSQHNDNKQGWQVHWKNSSNFYLPSINKCPGGLNPLCIAKSVQQMTEDKREKWKTFLQK